MRAVVTGAAGFIGSHLVETLIDRGYVVVGIDRESRSAEGGYQHVSHDLAVDPRKAGLADLILDADVVFHLAGRPGVRGSGRLVEQARWRDNVVSTRNVLDLTPRATPLVATSSSSVYGGCALRGGLPVPSREDDPLRPRGGYAVSKAVMERLCETRRADGGVVAVVRPFTVAGEGQRSDMAFSLWLDAARRGHPIRLFGSGTRSRDVTDVRDVVDGLIRAAERGVNQTVNIGTGVGHSLIEMARTLLCVSGLEGVIVNEPAPAEDAEATLADTVRCRNLLGFVPETDLSGVLARQVEAARRRAALVAS